MYNLSRESEKLFEVLKDISERQIHGKRDNDVYENGKLVVDKSEERLKKLRAGDEIICTCRNIAKTTREYLIKDWRCEPRVVEIISAGTGTEKYDNPRDRRHVFLDVPIKVILDRRIKKYQKRGVLVDPDMGIMYSFPRYGLLPSIYVKKAFDYNRISEENIVRLTKNKRVDPDFELKYIQDVVRDNKKIIEWYRPKMNTITMLKGDPDHSSDYIYHAYTHDNSLENINKIKNNMIPSRRDKIQFLPLKEFYKKWYVEELYNAS